MRYETNYYEGHETFDLESLLVGKGMGGKDNLG